MVFREETALSSFRKSWDEEKICDWLNSHFKRPLNWVTKQLDDDNALLWTLLVKSSPNSCELIPFASSTSITGHDLYAAYIGKSKSQDQRSLYFGETLTRAIHWHLSNTGTKLRIRQSHWKSGSKVIGLAQRLFRARLCPSRKQHLPTTANSVQRIRLKLKLANHCKLLLSKSQWRQRQSPQHSLLQTLRLGWTQLSIVSFLINKCPLNALCR